jgi:hypothetical protein
MITKSTKIIILICFLLLGLSYIIFGPEIVKVIHNPILLVK